MPRRLAADGKGNGPTMDNGNEAYRWKRSDADKGLLRIIDGGVFRKSRGRIEGVGFPTALCSVPRWKRERRRGRIAPNCRQWRFESSGCVEGKGFRRCSVPNGKMSVAIASKLSTTALSAAKRFVKESEGERAVGGRFQQIITT